MDGRVNMKRLLYIGINLLFLVGIIGITQLGQKVNADVPGTNSLVSYNYEGTGSANNNALNGLISADGNYAAYTTEATNVQSSGGDGAFERNLSTGNTVRVSVSTDGVSANADVNLDAISETGRYVLFDTTASNLIDGTTITTTHPEVYLRDTIAGTTTLISQNSSGDIANGDSEGKGVSADGRFVLFVTFATNLTTDGTSGNNMYMADTSTNTLTIENAEADGTVVNEGEGQLQARMSCDGSLIAFASPNYLGGTVPVHADNIYLIDLRGGRTITNITGDANGASFNPSISCDGNYIGFGSAANNLDPDETFTQEYYEFEPYMYNRINNSFYLANVGTDGTVQATSPCTGDNIGSCISLSDNGIGVFTENNSGLTGTSGQQDYLRNVNTGTTELISQNSSGDAANGYTAGPSINADGAKVLILSGATNLVTTEDYNGSDYDMFISLTGN
jgi:hypothetical protein